MRLSAGRVDKKMYFGVVCQFCSAPILFGVDPSDGNGPTSHSLMLKLTCGEPDCGQQGDYSEARVSRYRKASDGLEVVEGNAKR